MGSNQTRRVSLGTRVRRQWPEWEPGAGERAILAGEIVVDGRVLTNPRAQVGAYAPLQHRPPTELAGHRKLAWAIDHFAVAVVGRTALDVGACTGGFTTAWLDAGATRVYAVDAGHGQLLGSLRQDPRVMNLERTNVSRLGSEVVPEPIDLASVDVTYLSLATAVSQLDRLAMAPGAVLLGLVKPMFELRLATIPTESAILDQAHAAAARGVAGARWEVLGVAECPVRGGRGAVEFFLHARAR